MDSEIKKSIEDLKKTIQLLSQELANQLNSKLSGGFSFSNDLLNKLNIDLKNQPENLTLKKPLSNKNSSSFVPQKNINETDNKPLIDYDYIDENKFPDLLKNLKQYDRQMQQSQQQGSQAQFINFCKFAIDSIEAMLSQLIENEVKKISFKSGENRFLIACEKVSTVFAETQYPMPQLFIENSGKIATPEIIKIENEKYFDTRQVERITLAKRIKIFSGSKQVCVKSEYGVYDH